MGAKKRERKRRGTREGRRRGVKLKGLVENKDGRGRRRKGEKNEVGRGGGKGE